MTKREEFESRFKVLAQAPVAFATESETDASSEQVQKLLKETIERLESDPSLFSGDADGVFTYEDPVLALAAMYDRISPQVISRVGFAGIQGEQLRNASALRWIRTAVQALLARGDRSYVLLSGRTPQEPIKISGEKLRLAIVGDAGYEGYAQARVVRWMHERHLEDPFDLVIHLGDIYFSGSEREIFVNFLAPFSLIGPRVLTLIGNHDLYYGAEGYSHALDVLNQPGRYFSIETPHWIIACLDTALPADSLRRNEGFLDQGQLKWLDTIFHSKGDKCIILMSHHYTVSAWETTSRELGLQLRDRLQERKVTAWYWGHEHGCATYERDSNGFYGACVGNGSFLEIWREPHLTPEPSWYAKGRCSCYSDKESKFWPHGYLELELKPKQIIENYHLENGESHSRTVPIT
ncbi:MAG TPA: metallophosphoesterase [Pyrinomonadaceae bacterium]|nr:metallophosphoesterase [Pyrinomonadaceae bacterium]